MDDSEVREKELKDKIKKLKAQNAVLEEELKKSSLTMEKIKLEHQTELQKISDEKE
jgi:hypothetical protein